MTARLMRLDKVELERHLEALLAIDAGTRGEPWSAQHFRTERPGKWECSRLAIEPPGTVVGFLVASLREGALHVHRAAVGRERRGTGLGTALLAEAGREARRRGLESVTLKVASDNDGAIRFYDRLGFVSESSGNDKNLFMRASAEHLARADGADRSEERRCS
jgi:ribosomal protein S18 acetylase RimI-like enzyme